MDRRHALLPSARGYFGAIGLLIVVTLMGIITFVCLSRRVVGAGVGFTYVDIIATYCRNLPTHFCQLTEVLF